MWTRVLVLVVLGTIVKDCNGITKKEVDSYTSRIGNALFNFSRSATKYKEIKSRFESSESKIVPINLDNIFNDVARKLNESLRKRVDAIEKIMLFAEEKAFDQYNRTPGDTVRHEFHKSKDLINVTLTMDQNFQTSVNTGISSVHVPTSIYEKDEILLEAVNWSSDLDASFKSNYKENPTLSWQYFGSSTGFLRHFPATKWPKGDTEGDDQDLYDCRIRPWYVASANSPKNIVILQDVSGSMTGLRATIAKHVIYTILDTLVENDYVNVYNFSNNSHPLVDCFKDQLVEANLENIREFKIALEQGETKGFAEASRAFESAFDLLQSNFGSQASSTCNQAIMIITDGSSEYYKELFDFRNSNKHIRIFTFLIGREVTDFREVLWMACYNKGYYSHISTMGEVQEEVLKYLPVMSRPLVMSEKHHVSWTSVYADMAEIAESDWQWEEKTKVRQKERSDRYKSFYQTFLDAKHLKNKSLVFEFTTKEQMDLAKPEHLPHLVFSKVKSWLDHGATNVSERRVRFLRAEKERNNIIRDDEDGPRHQAIGAKILEKQIRMHAKADRYRWRGFDRQFRFVVSASIPVFDKRKENSSDPNRLLANFLGVVGTDVSIKDLQKITCPFYLGVNGYSFAITNNGYIVFHPDWRPLFDDILKPNYNAVDLSEIELVNADPDDIARKFNKSILDLREKMIDKETQTSSKSVLIVRTHGDNFKRVTIRAQQYAYGKIGGTPYTLGLVIPLDANRFVGAIEIFRLVKDRKTTNVNASKYFESSNPRHKWRLNPNWSYCDYIGSREPKSNETKEAMLIHFLQRSEHLTSTGSSWAWAATNATKPYLCDKELVQSLVFDARLTQSFAAEEAELRRSVLGNATVMIFVATRSGLTRWVNFDEAETGSSDVPFMTFHGSATEELWYKRAVDWNIIDEDIFVFSVPFDAGTRSVAQVTATQAIFIKKEGLKAPVAVVGIQFDMDQLMKFLNFSARQGRSDAFTKNACQSPEFDCFLLDENGFVLMSEERDEMGQFFGEIDGKLMHVLLTAGIYEEIIVTDYQAVCLHPLNRPSFASILGTPLQHLKWLFNWVIGHMAWLILQFNLHSFINPDYASVLADLAESEESQGSETFDGNMPFINEAFVLKTKLRPCDKKYKLYTYGSAYKHNNSIYRRSHDLCHQKCEDFLSVQRVPQTNLLLVVVQSKCRCGGQSISIEGKEVEYPMYSSFRGKTDLNPVLLELCRIPHSTLHRKKPPHCYPFNKKETDMKEDCGSTSNTLQPTVFWILAIFLLQRCISKYYFRH